jgi:hypothetical protein
MVIFLPCTAAAKTPARRANGAVDLKNNMLYHHPPGNGLLDMSPTNLKGTAMNCWSCNRPIPETATICAHCEAPVMPEPTPEEWEAARQLLENLPPEAAAELQQALLSSSTGEEFVDRIFVGDCPKCQSTNTGNCESDPEIAELLVGRCFDCGQLWCTECCQLLQPQRAFCPCWDDDDLSLEEANDA